MLVVAVVLLVGAITLVALVRESLRDGLETTAEQRATALAVQIETSGLPDDGQSGDGRTDDEDRDEPDELIWQVTDADGTVVRASQPLERPLPTDDTDETEVPGDDHPYLVVTEDAEASGEEYTVSVAASLEDVEDSTAALVLPLLIGLPLVLLLVGGTTWMVATRALAPVERIRREVEQITGDRLDRRVPEPPSRDEIHRLARTMNQMLGRLQDSRERQQQFVSDASHELRSPLASIRQTAEVTRTHPGALPEGELADAVLQESARIQRLVEQLLLLTRADEGAITQAPRDVDLDDLALAVARRVHRPGLRVDTAGIGAGRVRGDQVALAQVVQNLVDNAARHADAVVAIAVRETEDGVELVVEDDGPGIPAEHRQRVFDRFVRLDEARARDAGGSGLGLAIVQEIVAAHGGTVDISVLGSGRRPVRRTPSRADPIDLKSLSDAFRWASATELHAGANQSGTHAEAGKAHPMNISKLRRKRVILPTIAALAVLGVGGTVWTASANDSVQGDERDRVGAAAVEAAGGGTAADVESSDDRGEAYEVEVRMDDGTEVDVTLDQDLNVVSQEAEGRDDNEDNDNETEGDDGPTPTTVR